MRFVLYAITAVSTHIPFHFPKALPSPPPVLCVQSILKSVSLFFLRLFLLFVCNMCDEILQPASIRVRNHTDTWRRPGTIHDCDGLISTKRSPLCVYAQQDGRSSQPQLRALRRGQIHQRAYGHGGSAVPGFAYAIIRQCPHGLRHETFGAGQGSIASGSQHFPS